MIKEINKDPIGCLLEFLFLTKESNNSKYKEREEWKAVNAPNTYNIFWNGSIEPHIFINIILGKKDDPNKKAEIKRIFRILNHHNMIEPYPYDDSINPQRMVITLLGEELLLKNKYLEVINGLKYIVDKWKSSVAKIYDSKEPGIGTGFLIDSNKLATAKHVVEQIKNIEIQFENDPIRYQAGKIKLPTKTNDLDIAIIELNTPVKDKLPFSISNDYNLLDDVVILGYPPVPMSDDAYLVANKGEISSIITLYRNGIQHLIVSTLIRGGNSGGPIINSRGDVIGVVTENLYKEVPKEELNKFGLNEGLAFSAGICSDWLKDLHKGII
ncbi:MAG: serine protease [Melioribacteraceae bacterium]